MLTSVVTKSTDGIRVLSLRREIDAFPEQGALWSTLNAVAKRLDVVASGPPFAVHHNLGAVVGKEGKIDVEVCIPVSGPADIAVDASMDGVQVYQLPGQSRVASITLEGSCMGLPQAYTALFEWIKEHKEEIIGPTREIYSTMYTADPMSDEYRCEIQAPLAS
ncbi:hypothetical protein Poli38472_013664 [Pythium oligandrum]|uniref:AraC effector-binding domain-containing protein n=1 Tax=Pythium oligandrum TaxID=41045 RepID=A0A8K1FG30_PYTOL|nr:hypothetical protein Poli38472_013664 [Pythium oligandrum]|eukprot:TMW61201.1 hypothetical protein Poli38472_013664 [Pythium oligandrum]